MIKRKRGILYQPNNVGGSMLLVHPDGRYWWVENGHYTIAYDSDKKRAKVKAISGSMRWKDGDWQEGVEYISLEDLKSKGMRYTTSKDYNVILNEFKRFILKEQRA